MYLGSYAIDDTLVFPANTHLASSGAATDADAVPAYRVYEDETGTAILTGNMAKLDDANTTGFYTEQLTLSAANGLEYGKSYTIYISAAVSSVTGTMSHTFKMGAKVDTIAISGDTTAADNAELMFDGTGYAGGTTKLGVDMVAISGTTAAADRLEESAKQILIGTVNVGATPTTTTFEVDDINGSTPDATDDHYNDHALIFTSGTLAGQVTDVADYNGTTKVFTVSAMTEAPANNDTFILI